MIDGRDPAGGWSTVFALVQIVNDDMVFSPAVVACVQCGTRHHVPLSDRYRPHPDVPVQAAFECDGCGAWQMIPARCWGLGGAADGPQWQMRHGLPDVVPAWGIDFIPLDPWGSVLLIAPLGCPPSAVMSLTPDEALIHGVIWPEDEDARIAPVNL